MTTASTAIPDLIAQIQEMPTPELIARLRAMNPPDPATMPPCPGWCTLDPGHPWDSHDDGRDLRGHQGPYFGLHVSVGSREFADAVGTHLFDISVYEGIDGEIDQPHLAREFAAHVVAAAAWIEAQA